MNNLSQYAVKVVNWLVLLSPISIQAALPHWEIDAQQSSIIFTAVLNNAPVKGQFKAFQGDILFDPNQLEQSHIEITVDMGSVFTSYNQIANTLKNNDWFDVKDFPKAIFKADKINKQGNNDYVANGSLTIKNKTMPIDVKFTVDNISQDKLKATGTTTIKRTAFDVGQGEWADIKEVKDDVKVNFKLELKK